MLMSGSYIPLPMMDQEDPATGYVVEFIYFSATRLVSSPSAKVTVKEPTVPISQKGKAELVLPRESFSFCQRGRKEGTALNRVTIVAFWGSRIGPL
ncbi:hypothetical protein OIU76_026114 [Salix suchowensis]|nr:hypothetical protein OIU76_026114 [Salix suchowensis]